MLIFFLKILILWIKMKARNPRCVTFTKLVKKDISWGTHLVIWGTDNICFVPMNSPHSHSNPPDWSEQEAGCCCTKRPILRNINNGKTRNASIFQVQNFLQLNSRLVWAWSLESSAPLVCASPGPGVSPFCEEVWYPLSRVSEWLRRCLACGEHVH